MERCRSHRATMSTDRSVTIGTLVTFSEQPGTIGRVRAIDKHNNVARVYFGTYDGAEVLKDVHVDDLIFA